MFAEKQTKDVPFEKAGNGFIEMPQEADCLSKMMAVFDATASMPTRASAFRI